MSMRAELRAVAVRAVRRAGGPMGSIVRTTDDAVVLTFDDGPDPEQTPRVLDLLAEHDVHATFFVLMTRARRLRSLLEATRDAGHDIALHGPDHQAITAFGYTAAHRRLAAARAELEDVVQRPVRWYRPPYGRLTPPTALAVRRAGLEPVLWSGTTWDWKDVSDRERRERAAADGRPGVILLSHDGIAGAEDGVDDPPVALADRAGLAGRVLSEYADRGLVVRSLTEALKAGRPVRELVYTGIRRSARSTGSPPVGMS